MKKLFTIFFMALLVSAQAQFDDGAIAPDFTATDINGNVWNLYDLLDEGKTVVIDISATWCGPCWSYHESGALDDVYSLYGPDGTDEMMVFWFEGDASTNLDCIYDLPGCNSSTMGDWTDGVDYPIIDDDDIANLYEISYYPTIYHICANRFITNVPQSSAAEIYAMNDDCAVASGVNNASIVNYEGVEGEFCGAVNFEPLVQVQNLGTGNLTSATIELSINSIVEETYNWTGDLGTFGLVDITFASLSITENSTINVDITLVNGVADDDDSNNSINTDLSVATSTSDNVLTLEITTDNYPGETTWEVSNELGNVLYSGGPYSDVTTTLSESITLPSDGCYSFIIYDSYGDGLTDGGSGTFNIIDSQGNTVVAGTGDFGYQGNFAISIEGSVAMDDVGSIVNYSGEEGDICNEFTYSPVITVQNQGANNMTSAVIEVSNGTSIILTQNWSGEIASSSFEEIVLDEITISEPTILTFSLVEVNGVTVTDPSLSEVIAEFFQNSTESTTWSLELQTDAWAEELYWQITNSNGDVLFYGGNEDVGADGGGTGLADPGAPGAFASSELIELDFELPNSSDCYDFLLVDSYGDGMVDGGGGYLLITGENGETIIDNDYTNDNFEADHTLIVVNPPVSVDEFENITSFNIYPNPAKDKLNIRFDLQNAMDMKMEIFNVQGQSLFVLNEGAFTSGTHQMSIDISDFTKGVYYLKISNDTQNLTTRFIVID